MTVDQADKKIAQIESLAREIEYDEELKKIDRRYSIAAQWVDLGVDNVSL